MIRLIESQKEKIIFFLSFLTLIYSFFLNEDGTGGGAKGDFEVTYGFILALQENLLSDPKDWTIVHTPLHFIILSLVTRIIHDPNLVRLLFCISAIILPYIFYLVLLNFNQEQRYKKNLILLASCIFFIPSFRYTSIWANDLITSIFFFLLSIYFFKKWEKNKKTFLNKNLLLQILFLVLATYTRQYFAVFFAYFLYEYYRALTFRSFINLFGICILSSIPVFFYTYNFPELLTGQKISINAVNYFLLGNSSIMSITLYPIILINFLYQKIPYKKFIIPSLISFFIVFLLTLNFNPVNWQGGGVNYVLSNELFSNNIYFYFSSFFTITIFIYLFIESKKNVILLLILLFMFFSFQVYQRYYDPMFFIIFFSIIKTDLTTIFFEKKIATIQLWLYFIIYYLISATDLIYNIT